MNYEFKEVSYLNPDTLQISGPFSPMGAGQAIAREFNEPMIGLFSVDFTDRTLYQKREPDGLTGYGHFLLVLPRMTLFIIDLAAGAMAMAMITAKGDIAIGDDPSKTEYFDKELSNEELNAMMVQAHAETDPYRKKVEQLIMRKTLKDEAKPLEESSAASVDSVGDQPVD